MRQLQTAFLILGCLAVTACASDPEPTKGDIIKMRGAEYTKIGEKWNAGEAMIAEGNALIKRGKADIKKGKKLINSGEDQVEDGERMVKKGRNAKAEAEEAFDLKSM